MRFDPLIDQADGLRRMLARSNARVVTVVGARSGLGATSVVLNLASAWAWSGKEVLILDEHLTTNNVANSLALKPRYDLLNVVRGDKTLHQVMLRAGDGVKVLPVARATIALPKLDKVERERFSSTLMQAAHGMDVVLVDASARAFSSVSTSLSGDEPMLLVLTGTVSGITESYSMLKQMSRQNGRQVFDIVVNKVKDEAEAQAVFDNMAQVAELNLQVQLVYMGYIPIDEKLQRATQLCRPVMEAFPRSLCAIAFNKLAQNLVQASNDLEDEEIGLASIMQRLMQQTRPPRVVSALT